MDDISVGREAILNNDFDPNWRPSEQAEERNSASSSTGRINNIAVVEDRSTSSESDSVRSSIKEIVHEFIPQINFSKQGAFLNDRVELSDDEDFSDDEEIVTTSSEASSRETSVDGLSQIPPAEKATSQESIDFYCNSYLAAAQKLVGKYGASLPEPTPTEQAPPTSPREAKAAIKAKIIEIDVVVRTVMRNYGLLKEIYKSNIYGIITPLKKIKIFQTALNEARNEAEWPVIEKIIPAPTSSSPLYKSIITPASNLPIVTDHYKASQIHGVASSDTQNPHCSVNHARDQLTDGSGRVLLSVNRSGVSTSNYNATEDTIMESASILDSESAIELKKWPAITGADLGPINIFENSIADLATEYCNQYPLSNRSQVEVQLRRMLQNIIVGLDGKHMLASASVDEVSPTSYHMLSYGLLSHFKTDESTMSDLNFQLIHFLNTQTIPFPLSEFDSEGKEKTVYIKPVILALDFGVEQTTRLGVSFTEHGSSWLPGMQASSLCQQTNNATLDRLLENSGLVADILTGNASETTYTGGITFNGKILSEDDKKVTQALWQESRALRTAGRSFTDTTDYALIARLIVLCDRLGIDPHIFCKSGKDRTSRAIEEAKALAITIENNLINKKAPLFGTHGSDADTSNEEENPYLNYLVTVINVALHAGNSEVQQRNTGLRGNKQFLAFEARLSPPYVDAHMKNALEEHFKCSINEIVKEYAGLSKMAKT